MCSDIPLTWSVVIPVKLLAQAKSRLSGLADADREAMALAMAADTVSAAVACPAVADVVVVSDDPAVRAEAESAGAEVIADPPAARLHPALGAGAGHAAAQVAGRRPGALTPGPAAPSVRQPQVA